MTVRTAKTVPFLAIEGGQPVRATPLPYARQSVSEQDIQAVAQALRSPIIACGARVKEFEAALAEYSGVKHAVAMTSGTAALHGALHAVGIGPGDEVILPPLTFAATANAVLYLGATPVFADIDPDTLLLSPTEAERKISPKTKAILAVDYTGQPCDYDALRAITKKHGLGLLADACHSLGGRFKGRPVGSLADVTVFSFHPVKHITTGEGGMAVTERADFAERMLQFRNHGITTDAQQRDERSTWFYEMNSLGYNYRLTDFQAALGLNQLPKLVKWLERRREIALQYDQFFSKHDWAQPVASRADIEHARHLYVIQLESRKLSPARDRIFAALRAEGIGVNVHYIPVYRHPFYKRRFGQETDRCPITNAAFERLLTLPLFPAMTDSDVKDVTQACEKVFSYYAK